jgi:uncharacterized protein (TIGR03437 family)
MWGKLRLHGTLVLAALASSPLPANAQEIFYAREFLLTRQFKLGRDILPANLAAPMALHPRGIYLASAFLIGTSQFAAPDFQGAIRSYDSTGNELWTRQLPVNVFPSVLTVDHTAALYLAGRTGHGATDIFLRKYDENGNELWTRQLVIGVNGYHLPAGMAADASGFYFAAWNGQDHGLVRKYSAEGAELWTQSLSVRSLRGLSLDASGIYLAGVDESGSFVRKYDLSGGTLWIKEMSSPDAEISLPTSVAADSGGAYVGAASFRRNGEGGAYFPDRSKGILRRLDGNGNELWTREISASSSALITTVAVDASGVYVAGSARRSLPGQCRAGSVDVFVARYDAAGAQLWSRQFGTAGNDEPGTIAVDANGAYLSGVIRGGPAHGSAFVAKLPKTPPAASIARPEISYECVVNAAGYTGGGIAPGEIVTLFGRGIGPSALARLRVGDDGAVATTLAETRIFFNGVAAPLIYVSETQSGAVVPYAIASAATVDVEVEYRGVRSTRLTLPVAGSRPGIFTTDGSGAGQGAILNEDRSFNSPDNPALRESTIVLYATGEGLTDPVLANGSVPTTVLPKPTQPVYVYFDNPEEEGTIMPGDVTYAASVQGSVPGLLQINVKIPAWVRPGAAVPIYLRIGSYDADTGATVAIR